MPGPTDVDRPMANSKHRSPSVKSSPIYPASPALLESMRKRSRLRIFSGLCSTGSTGLGALKVDRDLGGGLVAELLIVATMVLIIAGVAVTFFIIWWRRAAAFRRDAELDPKFVGHAMVFRPDSESGNPQVPPGIPLRPNESPIILGRRSEVAGTVVLLSQGLSWYPYPTARRRGAQPFTVARSDIAFAEIVTSSARAMAQLALLGQPPLRFETRQPARLVRALQELGIGPAPR